MTTYTITGAAYANADQTAAVIETAEAGSIAISQADTPALWAAMLARVTPAAFVAPQRRVSKQTILDRLDAAGKLDTAVAALQQPSMRKQFARWTLPGRTHVNADDPDTVAFVQALGLLPAVILAP